MKILSLIAAGLASTSLCQAGWLTSDEPMPGLSNIAIIKEPQTRLHSLNLLVAAHTSASRLDSIQRLAALYLSTSVAWLRSAGKSFESTSLTKAPKRAQELSGLYYDTHYAAIKALSVYNRRINSTVSTAFYQNLGSSTHLAVLYGLAELYYWLPSLRLIGPSHVDDWFDNHIRHVLLIKASRERSQLHELLAVARKTREKVRDFNEYIASFAYEASTDLRRTVFFDFGDMTTLVPPIHQLHYFTEEALYVISITESWLIKALSELETYKSMLNDVDLSIEVMEHEDPLMATVGFYLKLVKRDNFILQHGGIKARQLKGLRNLDAYRRSGPEYQEEIRALITPLLEYEELM